MTTTNDNDTHYPELTPVEIWESGMLRHINATVLWPLGLAMTITKDEGVDEAALASARVNIQDVGERVVSGLSDVDAAKKVVAWEKFERHRLSLVAAAEDEG